MVAPCQNQPIGNRGDLCYRGICSSKHSVAFFSFLVLQNRTHFLCIYSINNAFQVYSTGTKIEEEIMIILGQNRRNLFFHNLRKLILLLWANFTEQNFNFNLSFDRLILTLPNFHPFAFFPVLQPLNLTHNLFERCSHLGKFLNLF